MRNRFRPNAGSFKYGGSKADKPPTKKTRPEYNTIGDYVQYYQLNHGERCAPVKWLLMKSIAYEDGLLTRIEQTPGEIHSFLQSLLR